MSTNLAPELAPGNVPTEGDNTAVAATPYDVGHAAGFAGEPARYDASPQERQGWRCGNNERRARDGLLILVLGAGSRCMKCGVVESGCRMACACWPEDGLNIQSKQRDGYRMSWGALTWSDNHTAKFMSSEELLEMQASGKAVVAHLTGTPMRMPD
jgi:hypothetical protein